MAEGDLLWQPSPEWVEDARLTHYMRWLDRGFETYDELWRWSVEDLEAFWGSLWEYFEVPGRARRRARRPARCRARSGSRARSSTTRSGSSARCAPGETAIVHASELRELAEISWDELADMTARVATELRRLGVGRGDRVVAYMPNIPETVAAFLATASIGAIWSSAAPEFGAPTVIDRFKQIEPKVLLAIDGYRYNGKDFDRSEQVAQLREAIPTLEHTVTVPYLGGRRAGSCPSRTSSSFEQVPFDHPLWVLYSSGTTGLPKAIVQGQGGILLEHLKKANLHSNLTAGRPLLLVHDDRLDDVELPRRRPARGLGDRPLRRRARRRDALWQLAADAEITCFGTSAAFIANCMKAGAKPPELPKLKSIGSTGSPLPPEGFRWVYEHVKEDVWLFSTSGGTDLCTAFVGAVPTLPVYEGELQARALGAKVEAWNEAGEPVVGEVGELVITEPMPSMPLFFWNDPDGERYRESYFDMFPGVWRHGDWLKITERGTGVIYGRSDSTINRQGDAHGDERDLQRGRGRPGGARQPGARHRRLDAAVRGDAAPS